MIITQEFGDVPGHPFRGNQWTDGEGGIADRRSQAEPLARDLHERALRVERNVTPILERVAAKVGAQLVGAPPEVQAERFTKTEEAILRKVAEKSIVKGISVDEMAKQIADTVRYTIVAPHDQLAGAARQTLDELRAHGFQFVERGPGSTIENYFLPGDDYNGINAVVHAPDGTAIEVQMHTPESLSTKEQTHADFKISVDPSASPDDRRAARERMVAVADSIPRPPLGILTIGQPSVKAHFWSQALEMTVE